MTTLAEVRQAALGALRPPPRLALSEWIERHLVLPEGTSAQPGRVRLWPYQRGIADAIGDPAIERVSLVKSVRVGFTTLLTGAIGSFVANEPCAVLCLLPTEGDARDYIVSDVEPIFQASPALRGALSDDVAEGERNTLLHRRFAGGSLKIVAARAPRNLRRHTARVLIVDEADGCEIGREGDPLKLAERRTLSFANRKIIIGSTPLFEDTSAVLRAYAQSDARVFECPCPHCGAFTELQWSMIEWPPDHPSQAAFRCPACGALAPEARKTAMVQKGRWRPTAPGVEGHAGFRLSALVSLHANASWGRLAAEFLQAKDDPAQLQVFTNTILGQGWRGEGEEVEENALASRAEDFGLDRIPPEVLIVTIGCDLQDDRLECAICAWTKEGACLVLDHRVIWGAYDSDETWQELDQLLRSRWAHPLGGRLKVDAACIDAGDGQHYPKVLAFCGPRAARRVMAIKGASGFSRPPIVASKSKAAGGARLWICGVDSLKATIFGRLQRGSAIRFSADLEGVFFEQLSSERMVVRYKRGQPTRQFVRVPGRRAEALDAFTYAHAAHAALGRVNTDQRLAELSQPVPPARPPSVYKSEWMER